MPKGDFNLNNDYDNNDFNLNNSIADEHPNQYNLNQNDNFSNVGIKNNNNVVDDSSVVFEDPKFETGSEKLKYYLSTLNKKLLFLIGIVFAIIITIIIIIVLVISGINAAYKSDVVIPDLIYMGETADINVNAKGKKNLEQTVSTFNIYKYNLGKDYEYDDLEEAVLRDKAEEISIPNYDKLSTSKLRDLLYDNVVDDMELKDKNMDNLTLSVSDNKLKGKSVSNALIPIQEGRAIIKVESKLKNRKMAYVQKKVTICPAFNSDLIYGGKLSIVKGNNFIPDINFGLGNCSEDITYTSSNKEIFIVNNEGELSAIKEGEAILTVSKGSRSFTVPVYVTKDFVPTSEISVTPEQMQLVPSQTSRIKISYKPINATSDNYRFISDKEDIVTVNDYGIVTGKKKGNATISCNTSYGVTIGKVSVVVYKGNYTEGSNITELKVDKNDISMIQGATFKINAVIVPENAGNKTLKYESGDSSVATVNTNGIIYAKGVGDTIITVTTSNRIQKTIKVKVVMRKGAIITSSDKIISNKWHQKQFALSFGGADSGSIYYYGTNENKITTKGNKVSIKKDTITTYYVKACADRVCSDPIKYVALLDTVKPTITVALNGDNSATIALKDNTSMVSQVCVTDSDESTGCNWKAITPAKNPVVKYTAKENGTYYVFAKDKAGNISDSKVFNVTGIE